MYRIALALLLAIGAFAQNPKDRMVVLISLDGFPAFAWDDPKLPIPTLRRLAREGAMAKAMCVFRGMLISVPMRCRSQFRNEADHDSGTMPIAVPMR